MKPALLLSAFLALSLGGCFLDSTGSGSTAAPVNDPASGATVSGDWDTTYSYPVIELTGNTIVNSYPQSLHPYCSNSSTSATPSYSIRYDTSKSRIDTAFYELHGNNLWVRGDTTYYIGTGGRVFDYTVYSRVSGSGIVGTWIIALQDTIIPLNIPESDSTLKAERDKRAIYNATRKAAGQAKAIEISSSAVLLHVKDGNWALLQMNDWNDYDAKRYAVTAKIVDANTITFTAGDTVLTKTHLDRHRTQVSSNAPTQYPTYVDYDNPATASQCSDQWFSNFLSKHYKSSSAARAASAPSVRAQLRQF